MMFDALGYAPDHVHAATAWGAVRKLLVVEPDRAYCQPCLSPIWDTGAGRPRRRGSGRGPGALRPGSLRLAGGPPGHHSARATGRSRGRRWRPAAGPSNTRTRHYPRCGRHRRRRHAADTAAVTRPMPRRSSGRGRGSSGCRAATAAGAPSTSTTTTSSSTHIPFADHGALLDPPTVDVTARCVSLPRPARPPGAGTGHGPRPGLSAAGAGGRWQLVRPLGHQLYLWHLVHALCAERGRAAVRRPGGPSRRQLADVAPAGGWRLGRG